MSLINEALKKAQRQRTDAPASAPAVTPEPGTSATPVAPRIAKRRPPMPARTLVILIGGGVSLTLMSGLFVFIFFLSGLDSPPEPVVLNKPAKPASSAKENPIDSEAAPAADLTPPTVQFPPIAVPAQSTAPSPSPAPVIVAKEPEPIAPAAAPPSPPVITTPPAATPSANPLVHEFLEKLRVSGIRTSDTDPKVIMNDRVYRLNDIVDRATQLRLTRVDATSLTFVDPAGFEYRKSF